MGPGSCLASKEAAQPRTGGNDWLYRDFAGDSALAAKADLWDRPNGMMITAWGQPKVEYHCRLSPIPFILEEK